MDLNHNGWLFLGSWHSALRMKQAQKRQEELAGAAAAKAAFHAQQAKAYEEAEERRRFELRVHDSSLCSCTSCCRS